MINCELSRSTFFEANKTYCEAIESKLKTINLDCSGFCNCYGYDIETKSTRGNLTFNIRYHKHQSTQNGIVIAVDAIDYAGVEVTVTGIDKKFSMTVGKSLLRRFFCSTEIKSKIPEPYFIKSNNLTNDIYIYSLLESLQDNNISTLKLRKGKLVCKIHVPTADPLKLISDIENTIKNWA
jgi:hypothetical protein